jgi:hypothetical protein
MISDRDLFGPFPPKPYRNRALLDLANGQRCVRCGANDGTIVACHYHGPFAHLFGKGMSEKTDDDLCAHLCGRCHSLHDAKTLAAGGWHSEEEKALEFLICVKRTERVLRHQGKLTVVINKRPRNLVAMP